MSCFQRSERMHHQSHQMQWSGILVSACFGICLVWRFEILEQGAKFPDWVFGSSKRCTVCLYWSLFWIWHSKSLEILDYATDWRGIATTLGGVFGCVSKWQARPQIHDFEWGYWVNPLMVLLDHISSGFQVALFVNELLLPCSLLHTYIMTI